MLGCHMCAWCCNTSLSDCFIFLYREPERTEWAREFDEASYRLRRLALIKDRREILYWDEFFRTDGSNGSDQFGI